MSGPSSSVDSGKVLEQITESRQKFLKEYAFSVLKKYFGLSDILESSDRTLEELKSGVFVTLKEDGDLRGCIGFTEPAAGILSSLTDATILAATEDPRFIPLTAEELGEVELEITLLDSPWPLESDELERIEEAINIGRDGLIVESRFGKGLLLPQVAVEWGFNAREFLEATCTKAGLEKDCWKSNASRVYAFKALSF